MLSPFFVFPKIGYINSQFQFVANQDKLKIEIFKEDKFISQVKLDVDSSITMLKLNIPGKYCAKCAIEGREYSQEFEIQNTWMLGSSTISYVKVFDDIPYTFVVMRDRLLIYDELKDIVYKEYLISPSNIIKLDYNNLLFTKVYSNGKHTILNLAIFSMLSFSIIAELKDEYKNISFMPNNNLLWLYDIKKNSIVCFFVFDNQHQPFVEKVKYTNFINFHTCDNEIILIEYENDVSIVDLVNIQEYKMLKNDNLLIDVYGNTYRIIGNKMEVFSFQTKRFIEIDKPLDLRCKGEEFFFMGSSFNREIEQPDISSYTNKIFSEINNPPKKDLGKFNYNNEFVKKQFQNYVFFPTTGGVFCLYEELTHELVSITYQKNGEKSDIDPCFRKVKKYFISLYTNNSQEEKILLYSDKEIYFHKYEYPFLEIYNEGSHILTPNDSIIDGSLIACYESNNCKLIIVKKDRQHILYKFDTSLEIILKDINLLNLDYIASNNVIWYEKNDDIENNNKVYGLSIDNCSTYEFNKKAFLKFNSHYIIDNDKIIDANNGVLQFNFIGTFLAYSYGRKKYVCENEGYLLLNLVNNNGDYDIKKINLNYEVYEEAFLSPNGAFLVLKENENKYLYYDIKSEEIITFLSGNFIKFNSKGEFIVQDQRRNIKLIDPVTFQDITPNNYRYYQFTSPDGELFASTSTKYRFYDILSNNEISNFDIENLRKKFDFPATPYNHNQRLEYDNKLEEIKKNRHEYFEFNKDKLQRYNILKAEDISSSKLFFKRIFILVGVSRTGEIVEVELPVDLQYFNYAAFSFDNKYLGIVGKPTFGGYIKIVKLDYDKTTNSLGVEDESVFVSRIPKMAAWVCAFSKNGHFATYDSSPTTHLIEVKDEIFYKIDIDKNSGSLIYSPEQFTNDKYWLSLFQSSFLCFSPTGRFMALSEQGYSAMSLGGIGHWSSKVVKLATISDSKNIDVIKEYTGFGDSVVENHQKNVTFCAFSDDETKLMVLTKDGVVTVHDIAEDLLSAGYELLN